MQHHRQDPQLASSIRELRKIRTLTLQGLSDKIGRSVGYVSQIERNISDVSIPVLKEIAEALDVNINWFFQGNANALSMFSTVLSGWKTADVWTLPERVWLKNCCLLILQGRLK